MKKYAEDYHTGDIFELGKYIPNKKEIIDLKYADLRKKYIKCIEGETVDILSQSFYKNLFNRIHFAFLDGAHTYKDLKFELNYTAERQQIGDVMVVDDYTKTQFPDLVKAINEFISKGYYEHDIFYGDDGIKKRGYVPFYLHS